MHEALEASTTTITSRNGDAIEAYLAVPATDGGDGQVGGVLVIHHAPGFDAATKEITRRFAARGYAAICPNLHHREAPGAAPDDAAAASRAAGGVPDERFLDDADGAIEHLRSLSRSNGRVGSIGFCSGGRQSVLAACNLRLDAAVDCYGAFVMRPPDPGSGWSLTPVAEQMDRLGCPVLGLFGNEDSHPSPEEVDEFDRRLGELGKPHEFHRFDGAGHGFFAVDRPSYRQAVAVRAWDLVMDFFDRNLHGAGA